MKLSVLIYLFDKDDFLKSCAIYLIVIWVIKNYYSTDKMLAEVRKYLVNNQHLVSAVLNKF